jgi:hypothetical protein
MEGIKEGQIWNNIKDGNNYIVKCTNMRFKDTSGEWIDGIVYAPMYESNWKCFVRSVDSFIDSFTLIK